MTIAEENRTMRVLLAEGSTLHDDEGEFCINGVLESGKPCPSCDWSKRVREFLANLVEGQP